MLANLAPYEDLILDLASYFIAENGKEHRRFEDYAFDHPLFSKGFPEDAESESGCSMPLGRIASEFLLSGAEPDCMYFMLEWNDSQCHDGSICIVHDLADESQEAGAPYIIDFDKAGSGRKYLVDNLAVAMDGKNRVPLFYAKYPGSASDVSQFSFMSYETERFRCKKHLFIIDRGPFCREHIRYLDEKGFSFLIRCRGTAPYAAAVVKQCRESSEKMHACHTASGSMVYGTTVRARLFEDDARERFFHVYLDPSAMGDDLMQVQYRQDRDQWLMGKHTDESIQFSERLRLYSEPEYDDKGIFMRTQDNLDTFFKAVYLRGGFCIITSDEMTAEEALKLYSGREALENLYEENVFSRYFFCTGRSYREDRMEKFRRDHPHGSDPLDDIFSNPLDTPVNHLYQMVSSIRFVEFVALIIRTRMFSLLERKAASQEAGTKSGKEPGAEPGAETGSETEAEAGQDCLTLATALCELERIEMCRQGDGS